MSHHELTKVGKYEISAQVGEGAMGVVYRALDPILSRPVAIKVMTDAVARDPELRDRFLREAQAAGSLQHPNVITIYDFGEVDGHLFIAMEYVEGTDLDALLASRAPIALEARLDIIVDVLTGLAYAHKRGVVHRDIKPANIRINEEGRAKIMDFGIAHLSSSNMTRTGVMMGTPNYMAPEQVTGDRTSPATDIFACGAVLFELLTGSKPFQGPTLHNVFFKIVSENPPSVQAIVPGLPPALDRAVQRALAKEPADRYATALDMANELIAVRGSLTGDPNAGTMSLRASIASTLAAQKRAPRVGRRARLGLAGAAGAAILAAAVVGWCAHAGAARPAAALSTDARLPAAGGARPPVRVASMPSPPASPTPTAGAGGSSITAPVTPATRLPQSKPVERSAPAATSAANNPTLAIENVRSLQITALEARQRALAAGASAAQLAPGDAENALVGLLILQAKFNDAAAQLTSATSMWMDAERVARAASTAAVKPRAADPVPVLVPPTPTSATPAQPVANPSAEIAESIASYARAVGSRDIGELRRAYPGLTAEQQKSFEQFFRSVRSLRADLTVSDLDINGASAEGKVSGAYEFVGASGASERQPVTFRATFRREGGTWKLTAMR